MFQSFINSDASSYCSSWSEELIDILLDKVFKIINKIVQIIHWWYRYLLINVFLQRYYSQQLNLIAKHQNSANKKSLHICGK